MWWLESRSNILLAGWGFSTDNVTPFLKFHFIIYTIWQESGKAWLSLSCVCRTSEKSASLKITMSPLLLLLTLLTGKRTETQRSHRVKCCISSMHLFLFNCAKNGRKSGKIDWKKTQYDRQTNFKDQMIFMQRVQQNTMQRVLPVIRLSNLLLYCRVSIFPVG